MPPWLGRLTAYDAKVLFTRARPGSGVFVSLCVDLGQGKGAVFAGSAPGRLAGVATKLSLALEILVD